MNKLQLVQTVVFSRHGIRTPLPNTLKSLRTATTKKWPKWHCEPGHLTTRGGVLESYFGDYFRQWLQTHGVTLSTDEIYVYANSLQRTVATAQYFTLGAFAGVDIAIRHKYPIERMDEVFNPIIRDHLHQFKGRVIADLQCYTDSQLFIEKLESKLTSAYELLAHILDYEHSELCQQYRCPFAQLPSSFDLIKQQEPIMQGPLALGTAISDAFILQRYSGFAKEDVAWGMIENSTQWQMIADIKNQYINLLFKSPILANYLAHPVVESIHGLLKSRKHKFSLLVGHDSNIASILGALHLTIPQLPLQFERTPIGGKVVFCRWHNYQATRDYFSAHYLYPTDEQLQKAIPLSLANPPQHIPLTFTDLEPCGQDLYLWENVMQKMDSYLTSEHLIFAN